MPVDVRYIEAYDLVSSPGFKYATFKVENRFLRINKIDSIRKKLKLFFDTKPSTIR